MGNRRTRLISGQISGQRNVWQLNSFQSTIKSRGWRRRRPDNVFAQLRLLISFNLKPKQTAKATKTNAGRVSCLPCRLLLPRFAAPTRFKRRYVNRYKYMYILICVCTYHFLVGVTCWPPACHTPHATLQLSAFS